MKKLLAGLLLVVSCSAFADQPISVLELQNTQSFWFDDTASIQSALNSHAGGTYTMPVFGTYHISSTLTVPANTTWDINFNIISTSQTTGQAIVAGHDVVIKNGTINGSWDYTTPANPSTGSVGIKIAGSNVTITNCTISEFSSSGVIESGNYNNTVFTHNTISKTGYIGFYCHPELNGTHDVNFSYNFVDRSMISATTVQEPGVSIRASTNTVTDTLSNVTIAHNTVNMPLNPTNGTAECLDMWRVKNSRIDSNSCTGGTIGASVVVTQNVEIGHNHFYNMRDEGLEMLGNVHNNTNNNFISGVFTQGGILIDMTNPTTNISHHDTLNYDTVITTGNYGVHTTASTNNIVFNHLVIKTHQTGFYLAQTTKININYTSINGHGLTGTQGLYFNTSPGGVTFSHGSIDSCSQMMFGYSTALNYVIDSVTYLNTSNLHTPAQKSQYFTNGSHWGTHLNFIVSTMTFNPLPGKNYGDADFAPGAVSSLSITYTSTGHHTSIVSGNIHILGAGTDTITASNGDTSITQPLVISKVPLSITANSLSRPYNSANPTLTATYSGFVLGETHTVLTTQPTLSTTAILTSIPGVYTISNSGAAAANYTITNHNGTLTILSASIGIKTRRKYSIVRH